MSLNKNGWVYYFLEGLEAVSKFSKWYLKLQSGWFWIWCFKKSVDSRQISPQLAENGIDKNPKILWSVALRNGKSQMPGF